ncbi:PDZ domain-containing protein [Paenibacillus sp. NPDC058071]|uniref:PDZ domain-containing protein n=1 Tax=Paenibacillus sp. NPDC058071 TaxID=3346326 RepID=UPI0036DF4A6B
MMNRRMYAAAFSFLFVCIVFVQLIWLPAPFRTPSGRLWIELIDDMLYGVAVLPLLVLIGAAAVLIRPVHKTGRVLIGIRALTALVAATAILLVLSDPERLLVNLAAVAAALLLALIDGLFSEAVLAGRSRGKRLGWPKRGLIWLGSSAVLFAALLYPVPYRVTYPAMTIAMNHYAHAEGGGQGGSVSGVLVFERPAFLSDFLYGKLFPEYVFERKSKNEPPLTEAYTQVVAMKTGADDIASAIAMQKAGIGKGVSSEGVLVAAVVKEGPSSKSLQAGDVIVSLNGSVIRSVMEMVSYMTEKVKPGDTVNVGLRRNGSETAVRVPTGEAQTDDGKPGRAVFGVSVQDELHADKPRGVHFKHYIAHIGGPSHGAMLTLALIDQLTPGGVTNGVNVAGTGTIEPDGSVGMVGGIPQKAYAVSRTDADVFFVPAEASDEARAAAPKLNIVPVQSIDDVLDWLKRHSKQIE